MLEELIQKDWAEAMKAHDTFKAEQINSIKNAIMKAKKEPGFNGNLTDSDIENIIQKMCKEREESAKIYRENGRDDLANKENSELEIISGYLPKQATEDEVLSVVERVIAETGADSIKCMGNVIKLVSAELGSRSNGKIISGIVKNKLNNK